VRNWEITVEDSLVYRSYLLRLWQVREESGLAWRATLEAVRTGEQRGFTSLEELIAYLRLSTGSSEEDEKDQSEG
jgi:hypothetical protein